MLRLVAIVSALSMIATAALAADPAAGKARFTEQCALCHSAEPGDGAGGMGPTLHGLIGKTAATADEGFPYSAALRASKLVWDAATLDRFLTNPAAAAPGTAMPVSVGDPSDREALIAYFTSLKASARH